MRGMLEIAAHPRQPNERDGSPAPRRSGARGSRPRARHRRERSAGERLLLCDLKRLRPVLASYLVGSRLAVLRGIGVAGALALTHVGSAVVLALAAAPILTSARLLMC